MPALFRTILCAIVFTLSGCHRAVQPQRCDTFIPLSLAPRVNPEQHQKMKTDLSNEYEKKRAVLEKKHMDLGKIGPTSLDPHHSTCDL